MKTMMKKKVPIAMTRTTTAAQLWRLLLPYYLNNNY